MDKIVERLKAYIDTHPFDSGAAITISDTCSVSAARSGKEMQI